jgi:hypothetical protein
VNGFVIDEHGIRGLDRWGGPFGVTWDGVVLIK